MSKKKKSSVLIHDDGTVVNNHEIHSLIFVILCRILTVTIALLGLAALVLGNL